MTINTLLKLIRISNGHGFKCRRLDKGVEVDELVEAGLNKKGITVSREFEYVYLHWDNPAC
jgi:hypothetical protein